jgi:two-component system, LytTR family, sensor kinase
MAVLYGRLASVEINSRPGRGTKVTLLMPVLNSEAEVWGTIAGGAPVMGPLAGDAVRAMTRG